MGPLAQLGADGKPDPEADHYHCSLSLHARPMQNVAAKNNMPLQFVNSYHNFAIHVDRYTREIKIFDKQWQSYDKWQKNALPHYKQLTGWNSNGEKEARALPKLKSSTAAIQNESLSSLDSKGAHPAK